MERDSKIKAETPSTIKKRKTQDNRKTPKSKKKLFSTQKNTILNYFFKNEVPQRDLPEENNEPANSSGEESLSNENETSNSSIEISTPAIYLKIKENKPALSSRAFSIAGQAISMSSNNNLSHSGKHLNLGTRSDKSLQYTFKNKIKSATEKEQLKMASAEGPGRSVKTLPRPTFVATNQSKVEMKIRRNIGNSTIVNSRDEFNTGNIKDNEVKGSLNDNGVILISDDSDDEKVLPQISTITRKNVIGKDNSDYNEINDENAIESSSQGTYSLSGSENTIMFDNSLSESENSAKIPKNSSVMEKEIIKQDSVRTQDYINSSMSQRHHDSDITFDGEETQQTENIFASSDNSNVKFNDLKKTKLRKQNKLRGNRDKFSVFVSSSESDSGCSGNFNNSLASESDNTKAFITKMKLNKKKKFTRKIDKSVLTFSPKESDSGFPGYINYNSSKESDSDAIVNTTRKSFQRKSSWNRKRTLNQSWKVVDDNPNSDASEVTKVDIDSQETSSKSQLECTNLKTSRITLEDKSKPTFGNKRNLIKRDIGRMAYFRAFDENVIIQYDTYTERIISLNEIEVIISDGNTSHKSDGLSDNSQENLCSKLGTLKRGLSSGVRSGEEIDLHSSSFIENDVNHYEQDNVRKQDFHSPVSESDSTESLDSIRTEFLFGGDSSSVDSDSEFDESIRAPKRKDVRKRKCILSSNSDSEPNKALKSIHKSQRRDKKSSNLAKKSTYQRSRQTLAGINDSGEYRYTKIEDDGFSNSTINRNNRYTSIKTDLEKMAPMTYNKTVMKSYIGVCQVALYQTLRQFVSKTRSNYLDLGLDFDYDLLRSWQEKTIEETIKKNEFHSFHVIKGNTSLVGLPQPNVLWLLVDEVLEAHGIDQSIDAYCLLKENNLLRLSSDKDAGRYKFILRNDYDNNSDANFQLTPTLDYILGLVRDVTERKQLILEYVVALLAYNLEAFVKDTKGVVKDIKSLSNLLLWKMVWEKSPDCHMNHNIKQILETLKITSVQEPFEKVEDSVYQLLKLLEMIGLIFSWKEEIKSKKRPGFCCYYLTIELQKVYAEVLFKNNKVKMSTKRFFVDNLKPAWLALHVIEDLIRRYSRCLCKEEMEYLLEDPLSMEKIVYCYFFIYPYHDYVDMQDDKRNLDDKKRVSRLYSNFRSLPNPNKRNVKGENALHIACKNNRSHQVKELLENGFNPNLLDNYGWTALHEASNFGNVASVRELLKSTALYIYDASNGNSMSALHDAVQNDHIKVAKLLLQKGGKRLLNMKTNKNKTALDLATSDEMRNVLKQFHFPNSEAEKSQEKPYKNVSRLPSFRVTKFLYLLMKLVLIYTEYTSSEQVTVNRHEIEYQIAAFKRHIKKISCTETLKMKLYTSSICKALRHKVPVQQEMEEIAF